MLRKSISGYVGAGSPCFIDLAGPTGSTDRGITIPTSSSGVPGRYVVPFVSDSSHIDGVTQGCLFNDAVVAEPGFGEGQSALPTDVEME